MIWTSRISAPGSSASVNAMSSNRGAPPPGRKHRSFVAGAPQDDTRPKICYSPLSDCFPISPMPSNAMSKDTTMIERFSAETDVIK